MIKIRRVRIRSFVATGALLAGLTGSALAAAPSATAAADYPCGRGVTLYNNVTNPTSYKYMPWATVANTGNCWMDRGMSNSGVTALQKNLNSCYGYRLATDGIFGPATESALISVQKRVGVAADGDYGPNTANAMVWANYSLETGQRINCN
ncbi:peptidoglycan-binding domain-containing protein [Streptomyces albicerus]|uniref:peptidoglycan-binding domain-containing protein n=1 Tax=Streptomyces albicerus TaxID=2569859 RepID=UPI001788E3AF|nr:peptidoglycan-binding domain-containing protein [Streptomyces albicerus]